MNRSTFPNVSVKRTASGAHDAYCRECDTQALIFDDAALARFEAKHSKPHGSDRR